MKKEEIKKDDKDYIREIFGPPGSEERDFKTVDPLTFLSYRRKHDFQNKNI